MVYLANWGKNENHTLDGELANEFQGIQKQSDLLLAQIASQGKYC